ncbi:hypothetical protein CVIRNUC_008381 [Coccomyxa viridis]|uniref:SAP domain-containing protein n=1 Tax=Coccomyxa viridis TaxID=1274662 RepID=A0AAV1IFZ5_9CHLO|nr:hypothetical protein CVIRNUC_008381 [Coccomyxa viridis]
MAVFSKFLARPAAAPLQAIRMDRGVNSGPLKKRRLTIRAATTPESASLSKSTLRKTSKAKLESRLSKLGLETSGTKEVLIERLMMASQQTPVQASVPAEPQETATEEVELLQTEVARLQAELATTTEQLEAASAAAEAERLELGQLGSAMARLQAEHKEDHAQLLAAEAAAMQLQESCNQVDSLRAKQTSLADSITLMQSLLEEKDSEIELLKRQLEEFSVRAPAAALAVGMEGGVAVADRPAGSDWDLPSSWRPAVPNKPSLAGGVPFVSEGAGAAANTKDAPLKSLDIAKRHTTPLLLALAGAQVTAQAYMAVRSSLPKDYRFVLDATALATGCTLLALIG